MTSQAVLNELTNPAEREVFKDMYTDMKTGKALLNEAQLGYLLEKMQLASPVLSMAHFDLMPRTTKELTRIEPNGRILQSGYKDDGTINNELEAARFKYDHNDLIAKKLKTKLSITDEEKEDNIEGPSLEQHLLGIMGKSLGRDKEAWGLFSDTTYDSTALASWVTSYGGKNGETFKMFKTADGWIKKAANKVTSKGIGTGSSFDLANGGVEEMFDTMIYALPPEFRTREKLVFFVPFEVEDAYRNVLKKRGTNLGDTLQTGFVPVTYKNIPLIPTPAFDAVDMRALTGNVTSMLVQPEQMAWGIYKDVTIEPKRITEDETTEYYYRMRGDIQYYFQDAAVVSKITADEAKALPAAAKA